MNESECLSKMKAPADRRTGKPYHGCVIQVLITSSCNLGCFNCTQASQLRRKPWFMTLEQVEQAVTIIDGFLEQGLSVAVHCRAGLGRTRTILACYLVAQGRSANDATQHVRTRRPGSIETREQEAVIETYEQALQSKRRA